MTEAAYPGGARNLPAARSFAGPRGGDSLADVLERVLDKGVVIVGDIGVSVLDIELLTLRVRLLISSADTARSMGIDWWASDPFVNSGARRDLEDEARQLRDRVAELERRLGADGHHETTGGHDEASTGEQPVPPGDRTEPPDAPPEPPEPPAGDRE